MKKNVLNKLKRVMVTVMMASMLFTVFSVNSNAEEGVMLYQERYNVDSLE